MSKNMMIKMICILLCLVFALSACTENLNDTSNDRQNNTAMGRYVEREQLLPPEVNIIRAAYQAPDGTISLLASDAMDGTTASDCWMLYLSADQGENWTSWPEDGLEAIGGLAVLAADFGQDGNLFVVGCDPDFSNGIPSESEILQYDLTGAEPYVLSSTPIPIPLPIALRVANNGNIFASSDSYTIEQYTAHGEYVRSYFTGESLTPIHSYRVVDNKLAVFMGDRLAFYDIDTGNLLHQVDIPSISAEEDFTLLLNTLQFAAGESAYYLSNSAGLFRYVDGGELVEHLVEGDMTSFSVPTMQCGGILAMDDRILAWYASDQGCTMLSYSWDANTPTVPAETLHVYSLYDNPTIRQANAVLQRSNPDVLVYYEVGMEGGFATVGDAVSNLNTRLLAGDGPDVLILDALPRESFARQGALLDLSDSLNGSYMEPMFSTYQLEDGTRYAVPARFGVPVLLGEDDVLTAIHDLSAMVDWSVEQIAAADNPELRALLITQPEALVRELLPLCYPVWTGPDGALDRARVEAFLECVRALHGTRPQQSEYQPGMNPFRLGGLWWYEEEVLLEAAVLRSPYDIRTPYWAIDERGNGALVPLPLQGGAVYLPSTILAAWAGSAQPELAVEYINCVLSEPVQTVSLGDGFAVNTAAFDAMTTTSYWEGMTEYIYVGGKDDGIYTTTPWPPEERLMEFRALVDKLDTPAYTGDTVVLEIVLSTANAYFDDTITLEQAVDEIAAKLELYGME